MDFKEQYKDPRWQKKRLEIMERAGFACEECSATSNTLHIHHGYYQSNLKIWEYDNETLWCLCEDCHTIIQDTVRDLRFEMAKIHPIKLPELMPFILSLKSDTNG